MEPKQAKDIEEVMTEIKTPLSWWRRKINKKWLLPWCRDAVGYRENSKSTMVKCQHFVREAMWHVAATMAEEGILPEVDLFFFLKVDEAVRLASGERNPLLIMKAKQRKRLYPQMNSFKFDEFVSGFRMKPRVSF